MSNYPPGFNGIEGEELKTYLFEIQGEFPVEAYTEEGADIALEDNLAEILVIAYQNGDIEIK